MHVHRQMGTHVVPALTLALSLGGVAIRAATPTLAEQEVIEVLLLQDDADGLSRKQVINDTASIRGLLRIRDRDKFADRLRQEAQQRDAGFREAVDDFLKKNQADAKIVFPAKTPMNIELVSDVALKEIFSARHNTKPNGWDLFYQRFPHSDGLITISRAGIDSKGTVAIVYLGKQTYYVGGSGRIRVLKHKGKKWVLTHDGIGPSWVS